VVQLSQEKGGWQTIPELVDPSVTSYTATNLRPATEYKFRLQAVNDIGPSGWSGESQLTRTKPAAPSTGEKNYFKLFFV